MIVRSVAEEKRKKIRKRRIISQTFLLFLDVMIPIYLVGTKHVWGTEQYGICPDIDIFEGSGFTEEELPV